MLKSCWNFTLLCRISWIRLPIRLNKLIRGRLHSFSRQGVSYHFRLGCHSGICLRIRGLVNTVAIAKALSWVTSTFDPTLKVIWAHKLIWCHIKLSKLRMSCIMIFSRIGVGQLQVVIMVVLIILIWKVVPAWWEWLCRRRGIFMGPLKESWRPWLREWTPIIDRDLHLLWIIGLLKLVKFCTLVKSTPAILLCHMEIKWM